MEFYKEMAKKALQTLNESSYYELCAEAEKEKGLCHHDYTYHNIILDDMEYATEIRLYIRCYLK